MAGEEGDLWPKPSWTTPLNTQLILSSSPHMDARESVVGFGGVLRTAFSGRLACLS